MLFAVEGSNIYDIFADLYHQYSIVGDLSTADQPDGNRRVRGEMGEKIDYHR
jgi:hypothetical protein